MMIFLDGGRVKSFSVIGCQLAVVLLPYLAPILLTRFLSSQQILKYYRRNIQTAELDISSLPNYSEVEIRNPKAPREDQAQPCINITRNL